MLFWRCGIWHHTEYITAVTETEYRWEFEPTKYITHLSLKGELWDVFCKGFEENWLPYNGSEPYIVFVFKYDLDHYDAYLFGLFLPVYPMS